MSVRLPAPRRGKLSYSSLPWCLPCSGYLFLYAPRFALGISDPIHVMQRGMSESGYNLEVKIPPRRADEDVFELARLYNGVFLPLKDREGASKPAEGQR